jgi:hypothetical protein
LIPKPGAVVPNADVVDVVEKVPKGDGVPKTFGDAESVEKAEAGFGRDVEVIGPNAEAAGCELKWDDGHWVTSGLNDVGPGATP